MSIVGVTYWEIACNHPNCPERSNGSPTSVDAVESLEWQGWVTSEQTEDQHFCPTHTDDAYAEDQS